jgi:hypothetical protein
VRLTQRVSITARILEVVTILGGKATGIGSDLAHRIVVNGRRCESPREKLSVLRPPYTGQRLGKISQLAFPFCRVCRGLAILTRGLEGSAWPSPPAGSVTGMRGTTDG